MRLESRAQVLDAIAVEPGVLECVPAPRPGMFHDDPRCCRWSRSGEGLVDVNRALRARCVGGRHEPMVPPNAATGALGGVPVASRLSVGAGSVTGFPAAVAPRTGPGPIHARVISSSLARSL